MRKLLLAMTVTLSAQSALAAEHVVEMKNSGADGLMVFEPAVVQAEVGDTVRFVATNPGHNTQSAAGLVPAGANTWKGAINQEVTVTLNAEGVYVYQCQPHLALAMVGVIVAGEPTNLDEVKANASGLTAQIMMSQDRLSNYLDQVK